MALEIGRAEAAGGGSRIREPESQPDTSRAEGASISPPSQVLGEREERRPGKSQPALYSRSSSPLEERVVGLDLLRLSFPSPPTGRAGSVAVEPVVEILSFQGCPNHDRARALVERVADELAISADLRLVDVPDVAAAERVRFLGSPTIRVNGRDVEPEADERADFTYSCRVYQTRTGLAGEPDERWVRAALLEALHTPKRAWGRRGPASPR